VTLRTFAEIFALLAVQLRQTDADETLIRGYYEGLQDLEPELLKAAAERLARTAEWFPKTSEWRAVAEAIRREWIEAQREHLRRAPRPLCRVCDDTGWESVIAIERGQSECAVSRRAPAASNVAANAWGTCQCRNSRRRRRVPISRPSRRCARWSIRW
jgi:hypothetical protein